MDGANRQNSTLVDSFGTAARMLQEQSAPLMDAVAMFVLAASRDEGSRRSPHMGLLRPAATVMQYGSAAA